MNLAQRQDKFSQIDIYPVISPEFCLDRSPVVVLEATLKGGAKIVQLRDKERPERFAADFRQITEKRGALLIINDSVELALKYRADGVHLGQKDTPASAARQAAPELLIGVSCHNLDEALAAQAAGANYVNIGPIFPTKTKSGPMTFLGMEAIEEIAPQLKIPFTVMGGINQNNIEQAIKAGVRRVAMVTAITQADDVEATTRNFVVQYSQ